MENRGRSVFEYRAGIRGITIGRGIPRASQSRTATQTVASAFLFVDATVDANFSGIAYFMLGLDHPNAFARIPVSFPARAIEGHRV